MPEMWCKSYSSNRATLYFGQLFSMWNQNGQRMMTEKLKTTMNEDDMNKKAF